jgi:hypothetical protein
MGDSAKAGTKVTPAPDPTLQQAARHHISARAKALGRRALASVRPVAMPDEFGDIAPAGSCILLSLDSIRFVVTAAHVLDEAAGRGLYVADAVEYREVPRPFHFTALPASGQRDDDKFDIGFVPLPDSLQFDGCHFLRIPEIDITERPAFKSPVGTHYLLIGYPQNRFKTDRRAHSARPENLGYTGGAAPEELYVKLGLDMSSHLLVTREDLVVGEAGPGNLPKLHGLSGGAAWRFDSLLTESGNDRLVGVIVEQNPRGRVVVVTRIGVVLGGMRSAGVL